ncbi:hypothetical protein [Streptomyces xinghaiensis]|uniref:hypothetical protein n=1 Tax=Streptomyces xinghaiensis TaxID=1038928 RepID=UPI002E14E360|nr:hypothetical protein OG463_03065 [Streptomyces xinghaiensis]
MNDDLALRATEPPLTCAEPSTRSSIPVTAEPAEPAAPPESRGCLYALSQPPLMLFLTVIGSLLLFGAVYDLLGLHRW